MERSRRETGSVRIDPGSVAQPGGSVVPVNLKFPREIVQRVLSWIQPSWD
jgi:hypothetical protein